ncbi:MAG: T9SS type A sorting domain-containing protein [Bacteroidetes bacterium]|nr:T9SS type A sorting domain-containing protein [Bacteroidota bacterium]
MKKIFTLSVMAIFLFNIVFAQPKNKRSIFKKEVFEKVKIGEKSKIDNISKAKANENAIGPFGGKITQSIVCPDDPNIVIVSGERGLYKSIDAGANWSQLDIPGRECLGITFSNSVIYAFFKTENFYRSTDFGETWENLHFGFPTEYYPGIGKILIDPTDNNSFIVGFGSHAEEHLIYKAKYDEATSLCTWTHITTPEAIGEKYVKDMCYDMSKPNDIYVTFAEDNYQAEIYVSRDNGDTFTSTTNNMPTNYALTSISANNSVVYVAGGYAFASGEVGVYKSADGGANWADVSEDFPKKICYSVAIDPSNPQKIYAGSDGWGMYVSEDAGATWNYDVSGTRNTSILSINFDPTNFSNIYITDASKGVLKSTDGGATFTNSSNGIGGTSVNDINVNPANTQQIVAAAPGDYQGGNLYISNDFGNSWNIANLPALTLNWADFDIDGNMYVWSQGPGWNGDDGLYKSVDNGENWENLGPNPTPVNLDDRIATITFSKNDAKKIYMGGTPWVGKEARIYKTINGGESWDKIYSFESETLRRSISKVCVSGDNDQFIYAIYSETDDDYNTTCGILFSNDGGDTWSEKKPDFLTIHASYTVPPLCVLADGKTLYSAAGDPETRKFNLYCSKDSGDNWEKICSVDEKYEEIKDIVVKAEDEDIIYLLTSGGDNCLKYSTDRGNTWSEMGGDIYAYQLSEIVNVNGADVILGGGSGGSYKFNVARKRPINLATESFDDKISLTWEAPTNTSDVTAYNVYRNDKKINTSELTELSYDDLNVESGIYSYYITALYNDIESGASEKVKVIYKSPELNLDVEKIAVEINPEQTKLESFELNNSGNAVLNYTFSITDEKYYNEKINQSELTDKGVYSYNMDDLYPDYTSLASDDFEVAEGKTLNISAVKVFGVAKYDDSVFDKLNIYFFNDDNGKPGESVKEFLNADANYSNGEITASLPEEINFESGKYWFSAEIPNNTYGDKGSFKWIVVKNGLGSNFMFKNPKDGLGTGAIEWTSSEIAYSSFEGNGLAFVFYGVDETVTNWVNIDKTTGNINASENETFNVTFSSASMINGFASANLHLVTNNPLQAEFDVKLALNIIYSYLPPANFALTQDGKNVNFTWEDNNSCIYTPTSYNIYRNEVLVNENPITEKKYTDTDLKGGVYNYTIKSIFENGESELSEAISIEIFETLPPLRLNAKVNNKDNVDLSWSNPFAQESWINYDTETIGTAYGFGDQTLSSVIVFEEDYISTFAGMKFEKIKFFVHEGANGLSNYTLQIFKIDNDKFSIVCEQKVEADIILNDWNEFELTTPVTIEDGFGYMVGMKVVTGAGDFPCSIDDGADVATGLGNVVLFDNILYILPDVGADTDGNWKIRTYIAAEEEEEIELPLINNRNSEMPSFISKNSIDLNVDECKIKSQPKALISYNIYRDGAKINTNPITSTTYTDLSDLVSKTYEYYVTSIFDEGESEASNTASVEIIEDISSVDNIVNDGISIYPIPAVNKLTVNISFKSNIEIYNATGSLMSKVNNVENTINIDLSKFENGYYFMRILSNNGNVIIKKICVLK